MGYKNPEDRRRYHQQYYQAHKDEYITRARAREPAQKSLLRKIIHEAKDVPCADCGIRYPYYVMQFDHLGDKEFTIGRYPKTYSAKRLLKEIAKCEVVCANCHAEEEYKLYRRVE